MSTVAFISSIEPILKNDGTVNTSGTVEFYEPGTAYATTKAVYAESTLTTSLGATITLSSAGIKVAFLNGDYDLKVKDSAGSLIRSILNINPTPSVSTTAPNLVTNGSFESNTNNIPDSWTLFEWNTGANVVDSTDQSHGKYSMKFVTTGAGGGTITSSNFFLCTPQQYVEAAFNIKSTANIRNLVQLLWYDANQTALGTPSTTLYDDSATNPTSWTRKYVGTTPPAGAYFAKLKVTGGDSSNGNSGTVRYDGIEVYDVGFLLTSNNVVTGNNTYSGTSTHSNKIIMSGSVINEALGAAVASAASPDIWATTGNTIHITGTTTITGFATAPQAGVWRQLVFDGSLILTAGTNLILQNGGGNITTEAGGIAFVLADTTTQFRVIYFRNSPTPMQGLWKFGHTALAQATTNYGQALGSAGTATEANAQLYGPGAWTAQNMRVTLGQNVGGAGQTLVVTLRKNGADTSITLTINSGSSTGSDTTHTVNFGTDDLDSFKMVTSATTGTVDVSGVIQGIAWGTSNTPAPLGLRFGNSNAVSGVATVQVGSYFASGAAPGAQADFPIAPCKWMPVYVNNVTSTDPLNIGQNGTVVSKPIGNSGNVGSVGQDIVEHLFAEGDRIRILLVAAASSKAFGYIKAFTNVINDIFNVYSPLTWGSYQQAQNTTVYMGDYVHANTWQNATEAKVQIPMNASTVKNLRLVTGAGPAGGQNVTVTCRKNGADTSVTASATAVSTVVSDLVNTATFAAGDLLSWKCVSSATSGTIDAEITHEVY